MKFQKGQPSPNPGGRPKVDRELRELARTHSKAAINTLVRIMRNKRAPAMAQVKAAAVVLDRGFGRPAQEVIHRDLGGENRSGRLEIARRIAWTLTTGILEKEQGNAKTSDS